MTDTPFSDREAAGRALAVELAKRRFARPAVFALPRGGVPVAAEIAAALSAPLDLLLVRKIGVPGHEELAAGSVVDGERPDIILNEDIVAAAGLSKASIDAISKRELAEVERRRALYLPGREPLSVEGCTAILVDDGIATGASMRAAIEAVRRRKPARIVVAVPVAARDTAEKFAALVDDFAALATPRDFRAVGLYYRDFHQLEDAEVIALLRAAGARPDWRKAERN